MSKIDVIKMIVKAFRLYDAIQKGKKRATFEDFARELGEP